MYGRARRRLSQTYEDRPMTSRRSILAAAALAALSIPAVAQPATRVSVWRDPNCGGCAG